MARAGITVNLGGVAGTDGSAGRSQAFVGVAGPVDLASVVSATATLVADGASPTQAHVTTLNGAVGPLNAVLTGDLWLVFDTTKFTTLNQLRSAMGAAMRAAEAGYGGALT